MYYIWATYSIAPSSLDDAGFDYFTGPSDWSPQRIFKGVAENRGYTESEDCNGIKVWRNPESRAALALIAVESDPTVAMKIAGCIKLAGLAL